MKLVYVEASGFRGYRKPVRIDFAPGFTVIEDKVKAIAKIIECDADDLLARAGRVSTDISDIIKRHPVELAGLLRTTKGLTADDITRLARQVQKSNYVPCPGAFFSTDFGGFHDATVRRLRQTA